MEYSHTHQLVNFTSVVHPTFTYQLASCSSSGQHFTAPLLPLVPLVPSSGAPQDHLGIWTGNKTTSFPLRHKLRKNILLTWTNFIFFCIQPLWFLRRQWECGRNEKSGCKLQTSLQVLCKRNLSPLMKLLLPVDAVFSSFPTDSSTGMTRLAWRHWTLAGTCPCVFTLESNMFTGTQTLQCSKAA